MKTRIVRIGNSRGVRLPKPLIEQAGLGEEVELRLEEGAIVIQSAARPRAGWAEAAHRLAEREGGLLDEPAPTKFDRTEWQW
jgi:antitoxin MazE